MSNIYLLQDTIISPLGFTTSDNLLAIRNSETALKLHHNARFFDNGYYAGLISNDLIDSRFSEIGDPEVYTKLEKLMILAIHQIIHSNPDICLDSTGLVIATTKGNIDLLETNKFSSDRIHLWKLAQVVADFFDLRQKPVVVSNACISGALAIKTASDFIRSGRFKNAIVAGGDLVTDFVLSGFQSFQAISSKPCRPFSKDRAGISLGETAAALFLGAKEPLDKSLVRYIDASTANDANHISGPSRSGEGLYQSILKLLQNNSLAPTQIDYISAHGTATIFNDEMESIAFGRAGLNQIPVNSFKGYYGHTLGASALLEVILTKHSLLNNELFASLNFSELGVSKNINIICKHRENELKTAMKTASGFGGCNLAMLLKKEN